MRLFPALLRRKMPNGDIHRGKNRLPTVVTNADVQRMKNAFEIEEKNMFYLRHPYLTPEQSFGHAIALGRTPEASYIKLIQSRNKFKDHVTIESRLSHLRYSESWD